MSKPNLTVFVCGTYGDLREERSAVMDAITRMHFQYGSMEMFGARPEAPIDVCIDEVRKSDVLVIIVGHRYGTFVPGTDLSFTETEYEEGYRLNKSSFVYIRDESVPILAQHFEQEPAKVARLQLFRGKLEDRHTVFRFHSTSELALQVTVDLNRSMARIDGVDSAMQILSLNNS